jgi:hypothetical protein
MKAQILTALVEVLFRVLTPDLLEKFVDMILDFVENKVAGTASPVDDKIVLPLCKLIRTTFNIEDGDK